eukprot:gene9377-11519_t
MDIDEFLALPNTAVKQIVKKHSHHKTIVFAYDGTRRSYLIETGLPNSNHQITTEVKIDYNEYSKTAFKKLLKLMVMMFELGIKTIVYPMWFHTLELRGPEYLPKFAQYLWGLQAIIDDQDLMNLYESCGIRIIFYGEYLKFLERCQDYKLLELFELIMEKTKHHSKKTILFGVNIQEPSQYLINKAVDFYVRNGKYPSKSELIKEYYGVEVEDVSFYIGFDRFTTDGRPILISDKGNEDLYYTVSPHSFFSIEQFKKILYDHIFCRTIANCKEYKVKVMDVELMKNFYESNQNNILGCGAVQKYGNYWYPLPEVNPPPKNILNFPFASLSLHNINANPTPTVITSPRIESK